MISNTPIESRPVDRAVSQDAALSDAAGVAWMRTNLPELLDGYAAALDTLDFMRTYSPLSARPCALCTYNKGVFVRRCSLHEQLAAALDEVERLRAGLTDLRSSLLASSTVALSRRTEWAEQIDRLITTGEIG